MYVYMGKLLIKTWVSLLCAVDEPVDRETHAT